MTSIPDFTAETAKAALTDILKALDAPENSQKIAEIKENTGDNMLNMMQFVFPIVVQIQMDVIKNYGFSEGREGTVQFAQLIRKLEREDLEVARLHSQVKAFFIPPILNSSSMDIST
ncbi:PREDICTED: protein C10 [Polistes dominula]|uniref:Protein C10 n=1 Tax=Polistes dominula TaxID=743375 RepID=A0ABM1J179_POLDO|nr:PREDICTED: protein C10 [Polistes dominula]